ncbi:hypothetical protein [Novipirellula artificiosorum]|uniref:Ycf48-like protein n=1 Tax=Novipirellula artificiosorum TaxID=2528016 RepID=A0A5C6DEA1_9BACT|nr:hypothetical protein [Novipirellula artificiosorum]TWU35130.1 hypothetical protein Poly41_42740 [Novipirellula artificiosorum]
MKPTRLRSKTKARFCLIAVWLTTAWLTAACLSPNLAAQSAMQSAASYTPSQRLREDASLQAIGFSPNGQLGLAVGDHGVLLRSEDAGTSWQQQSSSVACGLNDVIWINDTQAVAVGGQYDRITQISRAVVIWSDDGGKRWQRGSDKELPRLATLSRRKQDNAVVAIGDWSSAAESREFESHDGGRSWTSTGELDGPSELPREADSAVRLAWVQATGASTVVRDVADVQQGSGASTWFAVGDHGVILRSERPSGNWEAIRGSQRRTAVLIIARNAATVPWPLIGSEALASGQRISVLLRDAKSSGELELARQAAAALGAAAVDAIHPADAAGHAIAVEAKNWISIHRPSVVVVDQSLDSGTRDAFTQLAVAAGIGRVIRYSWQSGGDRTLHPNALMPLVGAVANDLWEDSLQYVAPETSSEAMISMKYFYDMADRSRRGDSVTAGLPMDPGQKLALEQQRANRRELQVVQARLSESRRVEQLIRHSSSADAFAKSLKTLLDQTATQDQLRLAWSIHKKLDHFDSKTLPLAISFQEQLLRHCVDRFADHSFGKWSGLRLDAMLNSREWQKLRSVIAMSAAVAGQSTTEPTIQQVAVSPFQIEANRVTQASGISPLQVAVANPTPLGKQGATSNRTREVDLAWEFHPLVLIAGEASRQRGDADSLEVVSPESGNYRRLVNTPSSNDWTPLLQDNPSASVVAAQATERPKLDGSNDEPFWQSTGRAVDGAAPFQMGYDDQFVYLFVRCEKTLLQHDPTEMESKTNRDHDLSQSDRLHILVDTDLDLLTAFELETTTSGKTHDAVDGHTEWQPTWYVATKETEQTIDFELAILRRDLSALPIHANQSWFVSARVESAGTPTTRSPIPNPRLWQRVSFR